MVVEISEHDFAGSFWCSSNREQATILNIYVKKHANFECKNDLKEISEHLNPETKQFFLKLCQEKKEEIK